MEKATKPSAKLAIRYLKFNASGLHRHGEIRGLTDDGRLEIMNKWLDKITAKTGLRISTKEKCELE